MAKNVELMQWSYILNSANTHKTPVTFRAAGTSLSGQSISDSVLVMLTKSWQNFTIINGGEKISLQSGVVGAHANNYLRPYQRKIGPDPASIDSCCIGGIVANNASGMCCGTAKNSYQTISSMKLIFADGAFLDSSSKDSREKFIHSHQQLISEIENIRDSIANDEELTNRINHKYKIKNTTGYSLNAFVDYTDPIDIITHLMVGSEGTLGFIAETTYKTVIEHSHKATALIIFPDIESACNATILLKSSPVAAVELMDRYALRSVENNKGLPEYLKGLSEKCSALLVETQASSASELDEQIKKVCQSIADIPTVFPITFSNQLETINNLWKVRKGLFPAVGGNRKIGTTVIIEDVAFPIKKLALATLELQNLMREHGYDEGIIFGHALEGNLHFVFTQNFNEPAEVQKYKDFMDAVTSMVVNKYDGSLKAEHGTGRNMAPFVELEWGKNAYELMQKIKQAFDPENLLNPGVIINGNVNAHIENLKPLPPTNIIVDKCIECGFCEIKCPSQNATITPRQRIVLQREISKLSALPQPTDYQQLQLTRLKQNYVYLGEEACAVDGLCATVCPVNINTGELTKNLRSLNQNKFSKFIAKLIAENYAVVISSVRYSLKAVNIIHTMLGTSNMSAITSYFRKLFGNKIPLWTPYMPNGANKQNFTNSKTNINNKNKVVYFPSCVVRSMGPAKSDSEQRLVSQAMISILEKAGYAVIFPKRLNNLCYGTPFESKGFLEVADKKTSELEKELSGLSNNGEYPILSDMSTCVYRAQVKFASSLKIYDPVEFIYDFLRDKLKFTQDDENIAIHITCSSTKMGIDEKFKALASLCAKEVTSPDKVGCCAFAGDRGFNFPELNQSALINLKPSIPANCKKGYSNNRTCEIGLSLHSKINYQSIVYLVDRAIAYRKYPYLSLT